MVISPVLMVLVAIVLIFVIMVTPTLLFMRLQAIRGEVDLCAHKIGRLETETIESLTSINTIQNKITEINSAFEVAKARDLSTQESLRALGNKWNSRFRVESKRAAEQEKEEPGEAEEVDYNKIGIPLFPQQQQPETTGPAKRKFGSRP